MNKILYRSATILQILFIITAYVIHTLSIKKMGVMRFFVYMNHTWEELYPIDKIQLITVSILAIVTVIILIKYINVEKNGNVLGNEALPMVVLLTIMTLVSILFILGFSTEDYYSYYFSSFILVIVTLIQDLKITAYLKK